MSVDLGFVLPMLERPSDGTPPRWRQIATMATRAEELGADTLSRFADVGVTRVEIMPWPQTLDTLEALAPVFAAQSTAT